MLCNQQLRLGFRKRHKLLHKFLRFLRSDAYPRLEQIHLIPNDHAAKVIDLFIANRRSVLELLPPFRERVHSFGYADVEHEEYGVRATEERG
jgi:hypothetical protein